MARRWVELAPAGTALAGKDDPQPIVVKEPHYGEVLFYFYQDDYFPAIVRLLDRAQAEKPRVARLADKVAGWFVGALLIIATLLMGLFALTLTPREEEPQIIVPMADVLVSAPGLSAKQVERQIATPLEKLLYQIDGVEYVYSMSTPSHCVMTVRFYVGEDREDSLIKLYNKVAMNTDVVPPAVTGWVIKPIEIDEIRQIVSEALWPRKGVE